jgi:hypothetical protein
MAEQAHRVDQAESRPPQAEESAPRHCPVCNVKLTRYNPGPNCYRHTIGHPWRGPTAKPKF